jgi:putative endonuclease
MPTYCVYILASRSRCLYVGVTNDLSRRLAEHRAGAVSFTARYRCSRLVYVDTTFDVRSAIAREKQLKTWRRAKKLALIEGVNPAWEDLAARAGEGGLWKAT